jgi:DNA-binding transcriptional LysR family regulator
MLNEHPDLSIRLSLSDRNVNLVDDGIDIAIRIGNLVDSSLIAVKLGEVSRVVIASPAYLKAHGIPKSPAKLPDLDIITFESLDATNEWRFKQNETVRVAPRLTVNSADAAIAAAEAGIGIARTLSYQVKESVQEGRLIAILEKFSPSPSPVSAIYLARRLASANISTFVKMARDHFRDSPIAPMGEGRVKGT